MRTPRMLRPLAAAAFAIAAGAAGAQTYPTKPITVIVPFAAGGPTDVVARIVGEHMAKTLGQQMVIENITGAGGTTGSTRAAKAAPDGYTLVMGHMGTHGASPGLYPNLAYNPQTDFEPIGLVNGAPIVIVAKKDFAPKDLKEFAAYVKANEAKVTQAHAGIGAVSHITCVMLLAQIGAKPTAVPYRGTGPALTDLVGGQVDFMCDQITNLTEQVKGGQIKAYAVATPNRNPSLPNVPTTTEAGMPQFQVAAWNALFAPKGTPAPVLEKLNEAYRKALADEGVRKRLLDIGSDLPEPGLQTREALGVFVKAENDRWIPLLKAAGAQAQ